MIICEIWTTLDSYEILIQTDTEKHDSGGKVGVDVKIASTKNGFEKVEQHRLMLSVVVTFLCILLHFLGLFSLVR